MTKLKCLGLPAPLTLLNFIRRMTQKIFIKKIHQRLHNALTKVLKFYENMRKCSKNKTLWLTQRFYTAICRSVNCEFYNTVSSE